MNPIKSTPREIFMYLLGVIALYVSSYSLISLLFNFVDGAIADPLNHYYDPGSAMRWPLATLVIIFPVFFLVTWFLNKDISKDAQKADLRVRKWLVYLTLFLAALLIIGDLVALIYNFLGGDLTGSFIFKVLAVLLVAGSVFSYYLYDLRRQAARFSIRAKSFVWIITILVGVAVIAGFFVAGSPFKQRLVRFDSQKVSDLQMIQNQAVNYWTQKGKLPASQNDLIDSISGFRPPLDTQKNIAYEYRVTGPLAFELCSEFNLASSDAGPAKAIPAYYPIGGGFGDNWQHDAGRFCFERSIDPQLYGKPRAL